MRDANFTVTFTKYAVNIYSLTSPPIITGWYEKNGPRLWRTSIMPNPVNMPLLPDNHKLLVLMIFLVWKR